MDKHPALSRVDNRSQICSECGVEEALMDFARIPLLTKDRWAIQHPSFQPKDSTNE
jgi:hypothetical protein